MVYIHQEIEIKIAQHGRRHKNFMP